MTEQPSAEEDLKYMTAAIEQARKSKLEDARPHPMVGVVIVKGGAVLAEAFRGEQAPGDHAEYTGLERKLRDTSLAGSTVHTTLEPCTTRNHPKVPCAQRLIERQVSRVVVGMLDPNPNILGRGILQLREAGRAVELFPHALMSQLEDLNREFKRAHPLPPPITTDLLANIADRTLDDWYQSINRLYWNRNFQREASGVFAHLVEVLGSLSVVVSKKSDDPALLPKYLAKALAWWLALCGKVGVKSVMAMLWAKFPCRCPYCRHAVHNYDDCMANKKESRGPKWKELAAAGAREIDQRPKTIAQWQQMFATIYPPSTTEEYSKVFAKLTEEIGELAEALRVFRTAPGYFLSEAADVFAWLMKLNNVAEASVPKEQRGVVLQNTMADAYPGRCRDCQAAICNCSPILQSTIGRIAHEVPDEFVSYSAGGSFLAADKLSEAFNRAPVWTGSTGGGASRIGPAHQS